MGITAAMSTREMTQREIKLLARILSAALMFFSPRRMLIRGEPPIPIRKAAEPTIVTTGPHTPTPARSMSPVSGIFPMYILSTML